jgi:carbon-monoxide dehydrogenase catalytic subunit
VGELGICCTVCHLGPCNLGLPGSKRPQVGVCGANIDTVAARRLARDMAAGSAAHSDHGRSVAHLLLRAARGEAPGYGVRDERKLRTLAVELGGPVKDRSSDQIAEGVAESCRPVRPAGGCPGVRQPGAGQAAGELAQARHHPAGR